MFGLGIPELVLIVLLILFFFGAKRIPDIGKGLGRTVRILRGASKDTTGSRGEDIPSKINKVKEEIENMPGVEEIRTVKAMTSALRKWLWFLKH